MQQQSTIPQTPEEVAVCLSQMTKMEQCIVRGVMIGLKEARERLSSQATDRPGA